MTTEDNNKAGEVSWRQALATIGLSLALPWMIGVPVYIGWQLDKRYNTSPLWLIVWLAIGLIAAALDVYQLLKRFGQFK
jgi:F0F1-type ATP synthase assembly protein I